MSRSGYSEDFDDYDTGYPVALWRGAVAQALWGERGQMFLRAMLASLDALPAPRLIAEDLISPDGCCAMGAVAQHCGISVAGLDPEDPGNVAQRFGIARALASEIAYENDEGGAGQETPEQRFTRMRAWCVANIIEAKPVVEPVGGGS